MPSVSGTRWLVRSVIRDGRSGKKTRKSAAEENPRNRGSRWMAYDPMLSLCWIADFASGTNRFQKTPNSLRHRWNFTGIRTVFRSRPIAFPSNQVTFFYLENLCGLTRSFLEDGVVTKFGISLERETHTIVAINRVDKFLSGDEGVNLVSPSLTRILEGKKLGDKQKTIR